MDQHSKVVLAFSGGLDTSFCAVYLAKVKHLEVHTVFVNTGGHSEQEIQAIEQRASALNVASHKTIDARQNYYEQGIRYLIFGNVLRGNTYPLSVSAERMFQALEVAKYAQRIGANAIAHGSTGAGNDQVRFDLIFQILASDLAIITPIRELELSREDEVKFLQDHGYDWNWEKAQYSINQGLWGISIGGTETLTSDLALPTSAWSEFDKTLAAQELTIHFENGEPVGVNGVTMTPLEAIEQVQTMAAPYGIGRDYHIGDTIIGIKGRIGFEAAAAHVIIKAHQVLEKHTLSEQQALFKVHCGNQYGQLLHEGLYLEPLMRNLEALLQSSQERVSGVVKVSLNPGYFLVDGVTSPNDLMKASGNYGEQTGAWNGRDAQGLIKLKALPLKHWYGVAQRLTSQLVES